MEIYLAFLQIGIKFANELYMFKIIPYNIYSII